MEDCTALPIGTLVMRTIAMPFDTNANGDIFGGSIMSQMDLGAGIIAKQRAHCRVVTIAIEAVKFINPVHVGDMLSCYGKLIKVGKTSMVIKVEAWAAKAIHQEDLIKVAEGTFTFVALDDYGKPQPVERGQTPVAQ